MTKVSYTYLSYSYDGWVAVLMVSVSNSAMNRMAIVGLMGGMSEPCTYS